MNDLTRNWYVITGGPSTGKTTLLQELEKMGHKVIHEAARAVIDEGLASGLTLEQIRKDEKAFQQKVLDRKVEIESHHDKSLLTFFDRGIHDTIAYMHFYAWEIENELKSIAKRAKYNKVFLLEPLPGFKQDYARTEDFSFTKKITELLHKAYSENGHEVISVPPTSPQERVKFVMDHVNANQEQGAGA